MSNKKSSITSVVRTMTEVVFGVENLRAAVDRRLEELGESHHKASIRAGVSNATWSRTVNAHSITEEQFVLIANGLDMGVDALKESCR